MSSSLMRVMANVWESWGAAVLRPYMRFAKHSFCAARQFVRGDMGKPPARVPALPLGFLFGVDQVAVGGFVGVDYFLRQLVGDVVVVIEFHRIGGAALRFRREVGGVSQHLGERNFRFDDDVVAARFAAGDAASTRAEI